MKPISAWHSLISWLAFCPMFVAYRIIWIMALLGNADAEDVYRAMWTVGLGLPRIRRLTVEFDAEPEFAE